jgi:hypothetical protein
MSSATRQLIKVAVAAAAAAIVEIHNMLIHDTDELVKQKPEE